MDCKKERMKRLQKMGSFFIALAFLFSLSALLTPTASFTDLHTLWLSAEQKEGVYVMSTLFFFLGIYCFGGIWRKQPLI